jgi:hypothetical protein
MKCGLVDFITRVERLRFEEIGISQTAILRRSYGGRMSGRTFEVLVQKISAASHLTGALYDNDSLGSFGDLLCGTGYRLLPS